MKSVQLESRCNEFCLELSATGITSIRYVSKRGLITDKLERKTSMLLLKLMELQKHCGENC
jgi:hypothetical protein